MRFLTSLRIQAHLKELPLFNLAGCIVSNLVMPSSTSNSLQPTLILPQLIHPKLQQQHQQAFFTAPPRSSRCIRKRNSQNQVRHRLLAFCCPLSENALDIDNNNSSSSNK
jgi:hypothetical protein